MTGLLCTGRRVVVDARAVLAGPGNHRWRSGTVLGNARDFLQHTELEPGLYESLVLRNISEKAVLLHMDNANRSWSMWLPAAILQHLDKKVGIAHALVQNTHNNILPQSQGTTYPPQIIVFAKKSHRKGGSWIAAGRLGTPILLSPKDELLVRWEGHSAECLYPLSDTRHVGWGCKLANGEMVFLPSHAERIQPKLKEGDLARVSRGYNLSGQSKSGEVFKIPSGSIVRIKSSSANRRNHIVEIVSCPTLELLGGSATVADRLLEPLETPELFFAKGKEVQVTAEVSFRGLSLRGKRAKVILPTDPEGDVGLEFPENLRAGSLDGLGRSGYCLYVKADALKTSE